MSHEVPLSVNEIKEKILWNNRFIKIGQESHYGSWIGWKTVFLWVSKGILRIKDTFNAHDNFLSFYTKSLKIISFVVPFLIMVVFLSRFLKIGKMLPHMAIRHTATNQR